MKNKKTVKIILIIILPLAAILILTGIWGWRQYKQIVMLREQNYVASRLLELGYYEQGRDAAAQGEQMRSNSTSRELLVLAAGFQQEYHTAIAYAERFMRDSSTDILRVARKILNDYLNSLGDLSLQYTNSYDSEYQQQLADLEKDTGEKLLNLLLVLQQDISVKKYSDRIQALVDVWAGNYYSPGVLDVLKEDNSLLSHKALAEYSNNTGDYETAYVQLESLLAANPTFEVRTAIANLAATPYALSTDETINTLQQRQQVLYDLLYSLEEQYYSENLSVSDINRLNSQVKNVREEIAETQEQINTIPAQKAINFLTATTPLLERRTVSYRLELAQLYYLAGEKEAAQKLLIELLEDDRDSLDPSSIYLQELIDAYKVSIKLLEGTGSEAELTTIWSRLSKLLHFIQPNYYGATDNGFYQFVINTMEQLYNGVLIRRIDSTDFPVVRVTFNVAMELDNALEKKDFIVEDMKERVDDFRLLTEEERREANNALSVALVIDRSGSMGGTPLDDTKRAVSEFIQELDSQTQAGVITFDDHAEVIAPISDNKNIALQAVNGITSGGGTSIYSGLQAAGQELAGSTNRKVIVLLSDGADGSHNIIDEVLAELKSLDIAVYTIGFGGADVEYLTYIAQQCGGKFFLADSSHVLGEIYSTVGEYMANDYVLEFTAQTDLTNFKRHLDITVKLNNAYGGRDYHVGVPFENILEEKGQRPAADYFEQIGGSDMGTDDLNMD